MIKSTKTPTVWVSIGGRSAWLATCFATTALVLTVASMPQAEAVEPGDTVLVTTNDGKLIRGRLIDKTPGGFLLSVNKKSVVVPYTTVSRIEQVGASGSTARQPAPVL